MRMLFTNLTPEMAASLAWVPFQLLSVLYDNRSHGRELVTDIVTGRGCSIPTRDRCSRPSLLHRPRCKGQVLCLRKHVQYCQGCERGDTVILQRRL